MSYILLATALAAAAPQSPASALDRNVRCAATNAVVAAMLEGGEPSATDTADAAWFRGREAAWSSRAGVDSASALQRETAALLASVAASGGAEAAQRLLESRLQECDQSPTAQAQPGEWAEMTASAT